MSNTLDKSIHDTLAELGARRLYDAMNTYYGKSTPTPWDRLSDENRQIFRGLLFISVPPDATTVQLHDEKDYYAAAAPPDAPTEELSPTRRFFHHPMVVWETLILLICAIAIGHFIH